MFANILGRYVVKDFFKRYTMTLRWMQRISGLALFIGTLTMGYAFALPKEEDIRFRICLGIALVAVLLSCTDMKFSRRHRYFREHPVSKQLKAITSIPVSTYTVPNIEDAVDLVLTVIKEHLWEIKEMSFVLPKSAPSVIWLSREAFLDVLLEQEQQDCSGFYVSELNLVVMFRKSYEYPPAVMVTLLHEVVHSYVKEEAACTYITFRLARYIHRDVELNALSQITNAQANGLYGAAIRYFRDEDYMRVATLREEQDTLLEQWSRERGLESFEED